jgi:hypothetical protein
MFCIDIAEDRGSSLGGDDTKGGELNRSNFVSSEFGDVDLLL